MINLNFVKKIKRIIKNLKTINSSSLFDENFYIQQNNIPFYVNASWHFCVIGWRRGYNPSRFFDTKFYLEKYKDVQDLQINPLVHYLTDGAKELRIPDPDFDQDLFYKTYKDRLDHKINLAEQCIEWYGDYKWQGKSDSFVYIDELTKSEFRKYFDEQFYVSMNFELLNGCVDAYSHFINYGQYEYIDPAPNFDIYKYKKLICNNSFPLSNPIIYQVRIGAALGLPLQLLDTALIRPSNSVVPIQKKLNVCVHAHCFYPELISELIPRLKLFDNDIMIIITTSSYADKAFLHQIFKNECFTIPHEVRVVPNRGRDLGPFLIGCGDIWKNYDLVLHIHTKRSRHIDWGDQWRRYLFDQTMGSRALITAIIEKFQNEPSLGCLYPRNFYKIRPFMEMDTNAEAIEVVMKRLGYSDLEWQGRDYPAGSMAWYRIKPLQHIVEKLGKIEYLENETGQVDGTYAHALERILPLSVHAVGLRVVSYITPIRSHLENLVGLPQREDSIAAVTKRWYRDTPRIAQQPPRLLKPLSNTYIADALDIHWIIPSFGRGAGGHTTIFRMIELLEQFGHYQTIWIQNATQFADQASAKRAIQEWYRPIGDRVHVRFLPEDVRELSGDVLIATDCWTAFPASETHNFKERFYFVQDYEPSFHPWGELQLMAESTYDFGFATLCAGVWLQETMTARGLWSRAWDLCADHEVYHQNSIHNSSNKVLRIAFYARLYTPRRAVTLGFAAFEEMHKRGVLFHVDLFGEDNLIVDFEFPYTQHGILSPFELANLYRKSDIGVVFSTTNYSIIPLEMMACNLPVVEIDVPSTRAIFKNNEVIFAKPTPYAIANAIQELISDSNQRDFQRRKARQFVAKTSWANSARTIEAALLERLDERGFVRTQNTTMVSPNLLPTYAVTVFIPTYNAGPDFVKVLEMLTRQICDFKYDIFIIDSQSIDGTPDVARCYADRGVQVEVIKHEEFQHGRTRNQGIALSRGNYVAMITQDARPKDEYWLAHLIAGFSRGSRIAGVIGRHEAYPEHDAFTRRDMTEMFDNLMLLPGVIDREIGLPSYIYPGGKLWRMLRQFYSDNNSAISRAAWKILPYPEIDWGEDQVWADEFLRLGFQKAYVNEAVVYHSHDFDFKKQYNTSFVEGQFWGKYFGYNINSDIEAAISSMNARDQDFGFKNNISEECIGKRKLLNRAIVEGRAMGYIKSIELKYMD